MEIEPGQRVKVFCDEGLTETGIVEEYTTEHLILRLIDESVFIINDPKRRVIAIKISKFEKSRGSSEVFVDAELEPDQYYEDEGERIASLAEMRKMVAHEERKRYEEQLKKDSIDLNRTKEVYGLPNFSQPISKHPKKKT